MFSITVADYSLRCQNKGLPGMYEEYIKRAQLVEEINLSGSEGTLCFLAVSRGDDWPFLVVAQRYAPDADGFNPGALLIPETDLLFLGAGNQTLAFDLCTPKKLWEDDVEVGFLSWRRHNDVVVISAELECAAWDIHGYKLWSTFVEPPWQYTVHGDVIYLDVMGTMSSCDLKVGPNNMCA